MGLYGNTSIGSAILVEDFRLMGPNYAIYSNYATDNSCFIAIANDTPSRDIDIMIVGGIKIAITSIWFRSFCGVMSIRNESP